MNRILDILEKNSDFFNQISIEIIGSMVGALFALFLTLFIVNPSRRFNIFLTFIVFLISVSSFSWIAYKVGFYNSNKQNYKIFVTNNQSKKYSKPIKKYYEKKEIINESKIIKSNHSEPKVIKNKEDKQINETNISNSIEQFF